MFTCLEPGSRSSSLRPNQEMNGAHSGLTAYMPLSTPQIRTLRALREANTRGGPRQWPCSETLLGAMRIRLLSQIVDVRTEVRASTRDGDESFGRRAGDNL